MKASKLREMNGEELNNREEELSRQIFNLRFQLATGQLESAKKMAMTRRDLARVKTIQNEIRRTKKRSVVNPENRKTD